MRNLRRLADSERSPAIIRRMAILQNALEDPGWKETLAKLRGLPGEEAFATEKELAMWQELLGSTRIRRTRADEIKKQLDRMKLGWYRHPALEMLYRKSGSIDKAEDEAAEAQAPWNRMVVIIILAILVFLAGLGLDLFAIVFLSWAKRNPTASRPSFLEIRPPPPLNRRKGEALYLVFLVYLVSYAIVQHGLGRLLGL